MIEARERGALLGQGQQGEDHSLLALTIDFSSLGFSQFTVRQQAHRVSHFNRLGRFKRTCCFSSHASDNIGRLLLAPERLRDKIASLG